LPGAGRIWYLSPIDPHRIRDLPPLVSGGKPRACLSRGSQAKEEGPAMSESQARNGSRVLKVLGIVTLIGVIVAVGRIVLRVFNEKAESSDDGHDGI
jgi:hypothetical protein